jgi:Uma2 family endonuclease
MNAVLHLDIENLPESISWDPPLSDDQFQALAFDNDLLRLERHKDGRVLIHPPSGDDKGAANAEITKQLANWNHYSEEGRVYASGTGFFLPDSSNYSPDAAYVLPEKLGPRSGRGPKMAHHCPDFVIELLSSSDRLRKAQAKMNNWIANGAALAWLIDPYQRQVTVYAPGQPPQTVTAASITGTGPVEGLTLNLAKVWRFYET